MAYDQLPPSYLGLGTQLLSTNRGPNPFYNVLPNHPQTLFNQPLVSYSQLLRPFPQYTRWREQRHARSISIAARFADNNAASWCHDIAAA